MKLHSSMLGVFFVYTLALIKYADFQEKIFAEISGKKYQTLGITFLCNTQSLELVPRNLH